LQGSLTVERMCHLAQVSRSGFYRYLGERWPAEEELTLRSAIQDLVLEHRWRYGYRRVAAELRQRGMIVNRKRVARLMREDNLLTVRDTSPFASVGAVRAVQIYLNLPSRLKVSGPNQLWVADISRETGRRWSGPCPAERRPDARQVMAPGKWGVPVLTGASSGPGGQHRTNAPLRSH